MMSKIRNTLLVAICSHLLACASTPIHYHTLMAPEHRVGAKGAAPYLIEVLPVGIPVGVDQPQLVVRQEDGGIAVLDNERWLAPINEELRAALSARLAELLGTQDISGLPRPIQQPVFRVKLEVRRFDSVQGQYALLDADWSLSLKDHQTEPRLFCHSMLREVARGNDHESVVRAHQQIVDALAVQISDTARIWANSPLAACPTSG